MEYTDKEIIQMLGGTSRVSKLCKVSPSAVSLWMTRGIPALQIMYLGATLEKESCGLVTRKDLFPDTWQLVWPELVENKKD
jgi:DNA-binding transcriptional regulator YdaS (Cro superfamily)